MRHSFAFGHITRRQMPGSPQAPHRLDEAGDVAQSRCLGKSAERLRVGLELSVKLRRENEKRKQKPTQNYPLFHRVLASIADLPAGCRSSMLREDTMTGRAP
jgi:hypothetical protein